MANDKVFDEGGCSCGFETTPAPQTHAPGPFAWYWHDDHGCMYITGDDRKSDVPAGAKPLYEHPPAPETHVVGLIKRYDEHPDGGGMREDELGAYVRFETVEQLSGRIAKLEDVLRNFTASRDISYIESLKIARVELGDYRAHPSPSTRDMGKENQND